MTFDGDQAIQIVKRAIVKEANSLRELKDQDQPITISDLADLLDGVAEKIAEEEYFSSLS